MPTTTHSDLHAVRRPRVNRAARHKAERICELYNAGHEPAEIDELTGYGKRVVHYHLRRIFANAEGAAATPANTAGQPC